MKVTIKSIFEKQHESVILWIDEVGDLNLKIGQVTVCVDQKDWRESIKFANANPEPKVTDKQDKP